LGISNVLKYCDGIQPYVGRVLRKSFQIIDKTPQLDDENPEIKGIINGKDSLIATSSSGWMSFIVYSEDEHRFIAFAQHKIAFPGFSYKAVGAHLAVDPLSRSVAVAAFEHSIAVYHIGKHFKPDPFEEVGLSRVL
jgi:hypothetical protein